jgi:hypothetical protein
MAGPSEIDDEEGRRLLGLLASAEDGCTANLLVRSDSRPISFVLHGNRFAIDCLKKS